jgi:NADH:ubiquinone oxidoreductase subunit H
MDGTKFLLKEDIILSREDICLFHIGPAIVVIPVFLNHLVIPFGHHIILTNLDISVFF